MKSLLQYVVRAAAVTGLSLVVAHSSFAEEAPGLVRISKASSASAASQPASHPVVQTGYCQKGSCLPSGSYSSPCNSGCDAKLGCRSLIAQRHLRYGCQYGDGYSDCWGCQNGWGGRGCWGYGHSCWGHGDGCWPGCQSGCCNSSGSDMCNYFRCKFGYFIPTGAGGAGVPYCGKYARVYPQDPYYFDQRDGQAWGAQGYGMPMAVPLAPVVGHTYNYGWGTPSSRLTPVSRPAY